MPFKLHKSLGCYLYFYMDEIFIFVRFYNADFFILL
jgi:hypothetical protein